MEDACLGYEKLKDGYDCSLCKIKDVGNNFALTFWRNGKTGFTKFDLTNLKSKVFEGSRIDQYVYFNTTCLNGLLEASAMIQESSRYKGLLQEFQIYNVLEPL